MVDQYYIRARRKYYDLFRDYYDDYFHWQLQGLIDNVRNDLRSVLDEIKYYQLGDSYEFGRLFFGTTEPCEIPKHLLESQKILNAELECLKHIKYRVHQRQNMTDEEIIVESRRKKLERILNV